MALSFTERLVVVNHLREKGFRRWLFLPGMLYGSQEVWWPKPKVALRPRPHEGLDLAIFLDDTGGCRALEPGTMIPLLDRGQVQGIFDDFLGQSILVAHERRQSGAIFCSIYAHIEVAPGVAMGQQCEQGAIIGRIASPQQACAVPAHLHLSTLWLTGELAGEVSWQQLNNRVGVRMIDPLEFIGS